MGSFRRFLLSIGFLGSMLFVFMSLYSSNIYQEKRAEKIHQRQELRKQLLKELCHGDKHTFTARNRSLENMNHRELKHFIVDDKHGIIYCYIPKDYTIWSIFLSNNKTCWYDVVEAGLRRNPFCFDVACTHWKKVMYLLNQTEPYPDLTSLKIDSVHTPNMFPLLSSFSETEIRVKLKHYTKFLFVRDPFVRLISAYRDKFERNNQYFYEKFGRDILRLYGNKPNPPKTVDEAFASGLRISFHNFIQYLLDPKTEKEEPFEPHWRQMYRLCHPCLIQYDFVGHQETLQEDALELLKILKLQDDIKFPPSYVNMTSPDSVMNWFETVPLEDRRKLYKLYEKDFRLFGFTRPGELLDGLR